VSTTIRAALRTSVLVIAATILLPQAWAFYPYGFFNESGELIIPKWPLDVLDVNGDGDVSGPGDGVVLNFETGNGSDGFSTNEVAKLLNGYEQWERVSSAFLAFSQGPAVVDPVELGAGLDSIDAFNILSFESEDDRTENGTVIPSGLITVTLIANTFEDTTLTVGGTTFPVGGGEIVDVDTVIGFELRDLENAGDSTSMVGIGAFSAGLTFGLGYSALSNFDENATQILQDQGIFVNVEDRVIALRNFDGTIGLRGVTSTMCNAAIVYQEDNGSLTDSKPDLAPDDIAAVTYLYPRSSIDVFFNLSQRARTQALDGFASEPIAGAWIRAWCDVDNNPGTARVPFTDTITGLYEWSVNTDYRGHFELPNLFKQLETIQETAFAANYTFSCSEFLPPFFEQEDYDTTHGGFGNAPPDLPSGQEAFGFDSLFPAEVFFEAGNLYGLNNVNQGTPLQYDLGRRKIISKTSGKTLDVLLAAGRPMFGDQNAVCPLNVVVAGLPTIHGPNLFRGFRDNVLLNTAAGTALVDVYYRAAPTMAQYLLDHPTALASARYAARGFEWVAVHAEWLLAFVSMLLAWSLGRRYVRRRKAVAVSALLIAGALGFGAVPAEALLMPYDISDYVTMSSDVIYGQVTSVESYWTDNNTRIVTDVTVCVKTAIKGEQNEGGLVHFQLPTGRVGAVGRYSPDLPNFKREEEVVLFLSCQEKQGFTITGGVAGKYAVRADVRTGKKYVLPVSFPGKDRLEKEIVKMRGERQDAAKEIPAKAASDQPVRAMVELDAFIEHLRRVERDRELAEKKA